MSCSRLWSTSSSSGKVTAPDRQAVLEVTLPWSPGVRSRNPGTESRHHTPGWKEPQRHTCLFLYLPSPRRKFCRNREVVAFGPAGRSDRNAFTTFRLVLLEGEAIEASGRVLRFSKHSLRRSGRSLGDNEKTPPQKFARRRHDPRPGSRAIFPDAIDLDGKNEDLEVS